MKLPISHDDLKDLLIREKLISEDDWFSAKKNAARRRRAIQEVLIERGFFSETYIFELIASTLKLPYVNLRAIKIDDQILRLLPEDVADSTRCIAFATKPQSDMIKVGCVNPIDEKTIASVRQTLQKEIEPYLISEKSFRYAARLYNADVKEELLKIINQHIQKVEGKILVGADLPVVKIFDILLEYALFEQASDIHIEPLADAVLVRFRIDGELEDKIELPYSTKDAMIARIKILANLKIDEHRIPQDGRISFKVDEEEESARVSVIPTLYGEKAVLRLLSEESQYLTLKDLGLSKVNLELVMRQIKKPFGMILVVGPTGSGKTTTLYAILNLLNTEGVNISTIEDPIEYGIRRINQTQVNTVAGYSFASGLRSLLRQDPDIIMIGEIRDGETAQIAVRAALTGHLVLSTLHTNNAAGVPPRLLNMDVEPFLVASTLNIVVAQRLVRKICRSCIATYKLTPSEIRELSREYDLREIVARMKKTGVVEANVMKFSSLNFYKGKGCNQCHNTGYSGRLGVMEVMVNSPAIQQGIIKRQTSEDLQAIALNNGMVPIFNDALQKSLLGLTTLEEVLRIIKD